MLGGMAEQAAREADAKRHQAAAEIIAARDEAVIRKLRESRVAGGHDHCDRGLPDRRS